MTSASKPVAATPMAFARAIEAAYRRYGVDPAPALRQAQITAHDLARPQARMSVSQFEALSSHAMQELDDEALGWFSRRLPWGSYGMLSRASVTAPNLGIALRRWVRHHRLLTDDVLLHLDVAGDVATLRIEELRPPADAVRELCLVTLLRYVHGFASWAIDSRIALHRVQFAYLAPAHADMYSKMFPGPAVFGAAATSMDFDALYLSLPLVRDEAAMRAMLRSALPLTVRPYRRDRLLVDRVRALLREDSAATAMTLAAALAVSVRTLHRQLNAEGAGLQTLKDETRMTRAMALLRQTDRPLKQIAQAAGFRNEKSFARAFRSWTGQAPGVWRRKTGAAPLQPGSA